MEVLLGIKELLQHSFTIEVSEATIPPTLPLAW